MRNSLPQFKGSCSIWLGLHSADLICYSFSLNSHWRHRIDELRKVKVPLRKKSDKSSRSFFVNWRHPNIVTPKIWPVKWATNSQSSLTRFLWEKNLSLFWMLNSWFAAESLSRLQVRCFCALACVTVFHQSTLIGKSGSISFWYESALNQASGSVYF